MISLMDSHPSDLAEDTMLPSLNCCRHFPWVKGIVDRDVGWHAEGCRGACNDELDLGDLILFELVTSTPQYFVETLVL